MPAVVPALILILILLAVAWLALRRRHVTTWLRGWLRGGWRAQPPAGATRHLLFCFVDHYEPAWGNPGIGTERARVARWHQDLPRLCAGHRDADGRPPVHSFFYPEEEYRREHMDALLDLCRQGLGEIDIHLHHHEDTAEGLRAKLRRFVGILSDDHDALPRDPVDGGPRWGFIHGDWALANSHPDGRACGVEGELGLLAEEGCYADFTYPAAPNPCQPAIVNRIYYAADLPGPRRAIDHGEPVRVGGQASGDLMLIQGPLGLRLDSRKFGLIPRVENGDIRASNPPTPARIDGWVRTGIHVEGRPEWIIVKVHTHGTQEADMDTLLGAAMDRAYSHLEARYNDGREWALHYVSARELYNIIKAAEAGHAGNPGDWRDFLLPRPGYAA